MSDNSATKDLFSAQEIQKEVIEELTKPVESIQKKESPLKIKRKFTEPNINPLNDIEYEKRTARITETNGEVVFELKNLEVPKNWSQLATDILASKYCRRAGVPETDIFADLFQKWKKSTGRIYEIFFRMLTFLQDFFDFFLCRVSDCFYIG